MYLLRPGLALLRFALPADATAAAVAHVVVAVCKGDLLIFFPALPIARSAFHRFLVPFIVTTICAPTQFRSVTHACMAATIIDEVVMHHAAQHRAHAVPARAMRPCAGWPGFFWEC